MRRASLVYRKESTTERCVYFIPSILSYFHSVPMYVYQRRPHKTGEIYELSAYGPHLPLAVLGLIAIARRGLVFAMSSTTSDFLGNHGLMAFRVGAM